MKTHAIRMLENKKAGTHCGVDPYGEGIQVSIPSMAGAPPITCERCRKALRKRVREHSRKPKTYRKAKP